MRELLNETTRSYLSSYAGLSGDDLELIGHAVFLTAINEERPSNNRLVCYTGVGYPALHTKLDEALEKAYYGRLREYHQYVWKVCQDHDKFLYGLAAGLISAGLWVETPEEPEERRFAREWLSTLYPAEIAQSAPTFSGYLVLLEYLWSTLVNSKLTPAAWLRIRHDNSSMATRDLSAFFDAVANNAAAIEEAGYTVSKFVKDRSKVPTILGCLQLELRSEWLGCLQLELRSEWRRLRPGSAEEE